VTENHVLTKRVSQPPSHDRFGGLCTKLHLGTSPYRRKHMRSVSDSIVPLFTTAPPRRVDDNEMMANMMRRSASVSIPARSRVTPERPLRPRYGLSNLQNREPCQ
jgi:hypothetical protein